MAPGCYIEAFYYKAFIADYHISIMGIIAEDITD